MKWLWNFVSVSLVLAVSVLTGPTAKAGTDITSPYKCPIIIDHPGEYNLKTDVACSSTDGIDIQASDVTLHLEHHTIKGSSAASTCNASTGIFVSPKAGARMLTDVRVLGEVYDGHRHLYQLDLQLGLRNPGRKPLETSGKRRSGTWRYVYRHGLGEHGRQSCRG